MNKPNIFFLLVIALVALLPLAIERGREDTPTARVEQNEQAVPEARSSIAQQPATPEPADKTKPGSAQNALAAIAEDSEQETAQPWDVLPIEEPAATAEPLADLEDAYLSEAFDPDWATPLEESFHNVFDSVRLQESTVEQAECRTTLCRFAITHRNSAAQDAFVQAFLQSRLLPLNQVTIAQHSQKTADGSIAAVYFLARNELAAVQY